MNVSQEVILFVMLTDPRPIHPNRGAVAWLLGFAMSETRQISREGRETSHFNHESMRPTSGKISRLKLRWRLRVSRTQEFGIASLQYNV